MGYPVAVVLVRSLHLLQPSLALFKLALELLQLPRVLLNHRWIDASAPRQCFGRLLVLALELGECHFHRFVLLLEMLRTALKGLRLLLQLDIILSQSPFISYQLSDLIGVLTQNWLEGRLCLFVRVLKK